MTERMLIESVMPRADALIAVHTMVAAGPAATYRAARGLDFLTVRTPLLTAAMWLRGLPERLRGNSAAPPARLRLEDMAAMPGWLLVGERPGSEVVFGAVGRFWRPVIDWRQVGPDEFADFDEPGWGKIAANFSVTRYGEQHTLLSYQCRTVTTDPDSRRRFRRYWWLIRPFVAHIMRATVATIKVDAESRGPTAATVSADAATPANRIEP